MKIRLLRKEKKGKFCNSSLSLFGEKPTFIFSTFFPPLISLLSALCPMLFTPSITTNHNKSPSISLNLHQSPPISPSHPLTLSPPLTPSHPLSPSQNSPLPPDRNTPGIGRFYRKKTILPAT
jgi:hypothetical protein